MLLFDTPNLRTGAARQAGDPQGKPRFGLVLGPGGVGFLAFCFFERHYDRFGVEQREFRIPLNKYVVSGTTGNLQLVCRALGLCDRDSSARRVPTNIAESRVSILLLMDKILHDPKDPKLWELWYIPYNGSCRILSISRRTCCYGCGKYPPPYSYLGPFGQGARPRVKVPVADNCLLALP